MHASTANRQAVELEAVLRAAILSNEGFASERWVSLALDASDRGMPVDVDADRLNEAVTYLVQNAVMHSPQGSTVSVRAAAQGWKARVEIRDCGPGIPEESRGGIFQQNGSTGLGASRAIVQRLGGRMGFTTEVGVGTAFFFELPLAQPDWVMEGMAVLKAA